MGEEMRGAAGTMETRSEINMQDLKRDLDDLRKDIRGLLKSSHHVTRDRLNDAKTRLWETAQNIESRTEEQLRDAYNTIRDQGAKAVEVSRQQVEKRPLASLAWSFAAGMVLGRLLLRR